MFLLVCSLSLLIMINNYIAMFKFLQQRRFNKPSRPCIKMLPQMVYGHTHESSPHMLNSHSIYYKPSQTIPFSTEPRAVKLPPCVKDEFNIATQNRSEQSRKKNRRKPSQSNVFGITQGQFSKFLDHHKHYSSIGVIHKQNSENAALLKGKDSMLRLEWNKSTKTKSNMNLAQTPLKQCTRSYHKSTSSLVGKQTLLHSRRGSVNFMQRPVNVLQFKQRRQQFANNVRIEKDLKRKTMGAKFSLPSSGADHQLYFSSKIRQQDKKLTLDEQRQMAKDVEIFQRRLMYRIQ